MDDKTTEFLAACKKYGITRVAVGMQHKLVPKSVEWPFSALGSVFQYPKQAEIGERPAIWVACKDAGINIGCGNEGQHNYRDGTLETGVYVLKGGKWKKVD